MRRAWLKWPAWDGTVKSAESWKARSMLAARTKLVDLRRDLDNQMRGLCKGLGIVLGKPARLAWLAKSTLSSRRRRIYETFLRRCSLPSPV